MKLAGLLSRRSAAIAALAAGSVGAVLAIAGVSSPVRAPLVIIFLAVAPAMAVMPLLDRFERLARLIVAATVALVVNFLVAEFMLAEGFWSPRGSVAVVAVLSAIGLAVQQPRVRALLRRAVALARPRRGTAGYRPPVPRPTGAGEVAAGWPAGSSAAERTAAWPAAEPSAAGSSAAERTAAWPAAEPSAAGESAGAGPSAEWTSAWPSAGSWADEPPTDPELPAIGPLSPEPPDAEPPDAEPPDAEPPDAEPSDAEAAGAGPPAAQPRPDEPPTDPELPAAEDADAGKEAGDPAVSGRSWTATIGD